MMMMMVMISSESPSRQGARTELLIPEIEIASAAERRCVSRNMTNPRQYLGQGPYVVQRGASGGARGAHTLVGRGPTPGRAQLGCGCLVQPPRPPFRFRGSPGEL